MRQCGECSEPFKTKGGGKLAIFFVGYQVTAYRRTFVTLVTFSSRPRACRGYRTRTQRVRDRCRLPA